MLQDDKNRRVEPRALTAALIEVTDERYHMQAVLEDLSPSGACLFVDRKLAVGAKVSLSVGEISREATVKYHDAFENGFRVGIRFDNEKWPEPIRLPIHSWGGLFAWLQLLS